MPLVHALFGADITGKCAGKGKITSWKVLRNLHEYDEIALAQLGATEKLSEVLIADLETCICTLYVSHTELTNVADVRWWL